MTKIVLATLSMDEGDLEIRVSDVQEIDHVPDTVRKVIKDNIKGRKLTALGLPEVLYLGSDELKIHGAFRYGEIGFLEVEGDISVFDRDNGLVCITAYKPDKSYKELKEGKEQYIEDIKNKYPEGLKVE